MTEDELLANILQLAKVRHWRCYHPLPARVRKRGAETYRTQAAGDPGFPDVVLCPRQGMPPLPGRLPPRQPEWWELKPTDGELGPDQIIWRDLLLMAGAVWRLVRPEDWTSGRIEEWLA